MKKENVKIRVMRDGGKEDGVCYECVASYKKRTITFCVYLSEKDLVVADAEGFYPEKNERNLLCKILGGFFINEEFDIIF